MRQAIKEGEDDSTRTGTYIIWRTSEILREQGAPVELPSKATLYRLLAKLSQGTHALGTPLARRSRAHLPQFSRFLPLPGDRLSAHAQGVPVPEGARGEDARLDHVRGAAQRDHRRLRPAAARRRSR
jgi:hypothetical protein